MFTFTYNVIILEYKSSRRVLKHINKVPQLFCTWQAIQWGGGWGGDLILIPSNLL